MIVFACDHLRFSGLSRVCGTPGKILTLSEQGGACGPYKTFVGNRPYVHYRRAGMTPFWAIKSAVHRYIPFTPMCHNRMILRQEGTCPDRALYVHVNSDRVRRHSAKTSYGAREIGKHKASAFAPQSVVPPYLPALADAARGLPLRANVFVGAVRESPTRSVTLSLAVVGRRCESRPVS